MHILPLFVLFSTVYALDCNQVKRTPQVQPASYRGTGAASRSKFETLVRAQATLANPAIPAVCDEAFRVVTYNIHYHRDLHDSAGNNDLVKGDLLKFNPSAVIFQEVEANSNARQEFDKMLDSLGYRNRVFAAAKSAWLGNMIASKYPLTSIGKVELSSVRVLVAASAVIDGKKLAILGTHLEVGSSDSRQKEVQHILDYIKNTISPTYDRYVLGGDMNAHWNSAEIKTLRNSGRLAEVFETLKADNPKYTCWAGTTIDFIFASPVLSKELYGAYVYQTISSDHLPVMVDLKGSPEKNAAIQSGITTEKPSKSRWRRILEYFYFPFPWW
ncbi:hypothetical protein PSACC_01522 [Paramicrosporidium saccamoebae]|uniref:Endonuclease/exonuclease/phosphatase domain-containing protein n=1 Tax=Paramicrosporidium saccamoebae TaxID=1246581 RepID=A0A2H9TLQ0_9FUNG|nr:hypothetical protein PSACC_01522 [Paramicrosporidium saccamoebae]